MFMLNLPAYSLATTANKVHMYNRLAPGIDVGQSRFDSPNEYIVTNRRKALPCKMLMAQQHIIELRWKYGQSPSPRAAHGLTNKAGAVYRECDMSHHGTAL